MIINDSAQASFEVKKSEWKTIGVRVRNVELPLLNKQLDRLNYVTLGDLVKDLIGGKLTRFSAVGAVHLRGGLCHFVKYQRSFYAYSRLQLSLAFAFS